MQKSIQLPRGVDDVADGVVIVSIVYLFFASWWELTLANIDS